MPSHVTWYDSKIHAITTTIPQKAFNLSAVETARIVSAGAGGGGLSKDLSKPKMVGTLHALVTSNKVHAGIQQWGGTIRPKRLGGRLLIGASRGKITASAESVHIKGKHFLEPGAVAFPRLFVSNLRRLMP